MPRLLSVAESSHASPRPRQSTIDSSYSARAWSSSAPLWTIRPARARNAEGPAVRGLRRTVEARELSRTRPARWFGGSVGHELAASGSPSARSSASSRDNAAPAASSNASCSGPKRHAGSRAFAPRGRRSPCHLRRQGSPSPASSSRAGELHRRRRRRRPCTRRCRAGRGARPRRHRAPGRQPVRGGKARARGRRRRERAAARPRFVSARARRSRSPRASPIARLSSNSRDGAFVLPLAQVHVAEVVRRDREEPAVPGGACEHHRFLLQRAAAGDVPLPDRERPEQRESHGLAALQTGAPRELPQTDRLLLGLLQVALPQRQDRSAPQRVDEAFGFGVTAERQHRGEQATAFGPVPPRDPVRPDRPRQPKRSVGVLRTPADGRASCARFACSAASRSSHSRPSRACSSGPARSPSATYQAA